MILIINGMRTEANRETELYAKSKYGWKVTVIYNPNNYCGGLKREVFRNVTEIHKDFDSPINKELYNRVAFESNVQGTGILRPTNIIKTVSVVNEREKAKHF
jgi:hypothetical protein